MPLWISEWRRLDLVWSTNDIKQIIKNGNMKEAYEQLQPVLKRVKVNNGFYEWYTVDNKPKGSGTFRGEAGVFYKAALLFET